ncbi:AMP-binding protein [Streptomyces chiangmaiensis]
MDRGSHAGCGAAGGRLAGPDLGSFLTDHEITVLCCVPTLLTTLEPDLPHLRTLLLSGEACPADLVSRWWRPDLRILNAYGPTETTVTATCSEPDPHRPVTIGTPLPTYRVYLLDEALRAVPAGSPVRYASAAPAWPSVMSTAPTSPRNGSGPIRSRGTVPKPPDLPHGRSWPPHHDRRARISGPRRHAGEDPRLPHRTR